MQPYVDRSRDEYSIHCLNKIQRDIICAAIKLLYQKINNGSLAPKSEYANELNKLKKAFDNDHLPTKKEGNLP